MAEGKKSFILYCDLIHTIRRMPKEEAGELFMTILEYVNDEDPEPENMIVQLTFEPIKQQLKRDLKNWQNKSMERSESGRIGNLKRWNPDLYKQYKDQEITLEEAENIAKHRKTSHSDRERSGAIAKIADNVNVNVNDTSIEEASEIYNSYMHQIAGDEYEGWRENLYMKFKVRNGSLAPLMNDFIVHLGIINKNKNTILHFNNIGEFQTHFYNWMLGKQSRGQLNKYIPGQRQKGDL